MLIWWPHVGSTLIGILAWNSHKSHSLLNQRVLKLFTEWKWKLKQTGSGNLSKTAMQHTQPYRAKLILEDIKISDIEEEPQDISWFVTDFFPITFKIQNIKFIYKFLDLSHVFGQEMLSLFNKAKVSKDFHSWFPFTKCKTASYITSEDACLIKARFLGFKSSKTT